jgi:serine/threonine-protein kinase OSR1/STK39
VHRAVCKADGEVVAVKKMNLERVSMTLVRCRNAVQAAHKLNVTVLRLVCCLQDEIIHEAQTMRCYQHPNVLPLLTSFVQGQDLWMVTPFMSGGSILHIMKYQYPDVSNGESSSWAMLVKFTTVCRRPCQKLMSCKHESAVRNQQI